MIDKYPADVNIDTYNVMPKTAVKGDMFFVSNYNPSSNTFTFVDEDFNLGDMYKEMVSIKQSADDWVKKVESKIITPPFI